MENISWAPRLANMTLKIIGYLLYLIIFTYCYFILNRRMGNKWILIGYPLLFLASIYPIKIWFDYVRPIYNQAFTDSWLKILLMSVAGFCLFNFIYGIINLMVGAQVSFHSRYGKPKLNLVKFVLKNADKIRSGYHLFFYTGGVFTVGVCFLKY
ncbi:hypothetical protein [Pedobacter sp. GR22-6]|uniref:hypothetical protein n=1 Tax=Pedobacter sp. GR22-6 TaxID=3127957 RepID=UPI00307D2503